MSSLIYPPELAPYAVIIDVIRKTHPSEGLQEEVDTQMLCIFEEVGEAVKAWRRFTGRARVYEDIDHVGEELADIIISTRITMMMLGIDEKDVIRKKLLAIVDRGGM